MQSTNSSSNTIIRENFNRYWPVPVLALLADLLFCMLPVIMNYRQFETVSRYAASMISGGSFVILTVITITAIVASSAVFGYLHDPVSATAIHALPINRKRLFGASVFSGWLFVVAPAVLTVFVLLTLRGATGDPSSQLEFGSLLIDAGSAREILTLTHAAAGAVNYIVAGTFIYAVCCLSAVLSGKRSIHVLLSIFLLALPGTFLLQIQSICNDFLYGFKGFDFRWDLISVLVYAMDKQSYSLGLKYLVYYIAWAAVLLIAAVLIYNLVKLERIGAACTFPVVGDVICILLTFISGIGLAQIIVALTSTRESNNSIRMLITALITSAICYLIMRMIVDSTPAVFNMRTVKKFLVYLAVFAVFMAFTVCDITRYQTRVPDPIVVRSMTLETNYPDSLIEGPAEYTEPETIEAMAELHRAAIGSRSIDTESVSNINRFEITYHLANGRSIHRSYEIYWGGSYTATEQALQELFKCPEFQKNMQIDSKSMLAETKKVIAYGNPSYSYDKFVEIYDEINPEDYEVKILSEDWPELIEAINKDIATRQFDQGRSDETVMFEIYFTFNEMTHQGRMYAFYDFDKNTLEFLEDKGYYEYMVPRQNGR